MGGLTGALFTEFSFAFTLAGTVVISAIIALTLSPMMCSKLLHTPDHQGIHFMDHVDRRLKNYNVTTNKFCTRYSIQHRLS